ncbi:MAG: ABC transporter ATP-binding protein [Elusimicrobiota bacterium]
MLKIENLNFTAGSFALKNITIKVEENRYFLLLGPTGSGKTLLLRCICGLERTAGGKIALGGKDITFLPTAIRAIGYMAQNYRLFPHLNVRQNILFGLDIKNVPAREKNIRLKEISSLFDIGNILNRPVEKLSGGERQRVALARTLINQPQLLLLDEPFSAIDAGLKRYLWFELKKILTGLKTTVIQVTHDIEEAMTLADSLAIIIGGQIKQTGPPREILMRPASLEIARYFGIKNIFTGEIAGSENNQLVIDCPGLRFIAPLYQGFSAGQKVFICIRPQSVKIVKEDIPLREELKNNLFDGKIIENYFYSDTVSIFVDVGKLVLELKFPLVIYTRYKLSPGKRLKIAAWQPDILLYHAPAG